MGASNSICELRTFFLGKNSRLDSVRVFVMTANAKVFLSFAPANLIKKFSDIFHTRLNRRTERTDSFQMGNNLDRSGHPRLNTKERPQYVAYKTSFFFAVMEVRI